MCLIGRQHRLHICRPVLSAESRQLCSLALIWPFSSALLNSVPVRPYISSSSSARCNTTFLQLQQLCSSVSTNPWLGFDQKAVAIPLRSAPVAPATSAKRFVMSTTCSVSKPNALSRLEVSISSVLVNGVTAPNACNSEIMPLAVSSDPVRTSKQRLFVCLSSSPA